MLFYTFAMKAPIQEKIVPRRENIKLTLIKLGNDPNLFYENYSSDSLSSYL